MKMSDKDKYRIKVLEKKIANGDLEAMMEYAKLYQGKFPEEVTPSFIPRDFRKAIKYYEQATHSDDEETEIRAWNNLGYCYYYGRDIPVDDEKAFNCYMRAAVHRDANALYKIGDMYRYGRYVAKDEHLALTFYWQALNEVYETYPEYPDITKRIGECALYGIGMEKDIYLALKMLARAELMTYTKIKERDPFAASLLPKIKRMHNEARALVEQNLGLHE